MNQDIVCEFIDLILIEVESGRLDRSEAREYLLKTIALASDRQKSVDIYVESVIRDIACS